MSYLPSTHFKKPKTLITTHSASQVSSAFANTYITITGTEISYTPSVDADSVIYDVSFYGMRANDITFQAFYLEHYTNSTWSEVNARYRRNIGNSGSENQSYRWFIHFKYILPAWTGSRDFRLRCASNGANREMRFHQPLTFDGSSTNAVFTNTNLILYSI